MVVRAGSRVALIVALVLVGVLSAVAPRGGAIGSGSYPPGVVGPHDQVAAVGAHPTIAGPIAPRVSTVSGGQAEIRVDSADPLAVPNTGLEMNLTGYPSLVLPPGASFEVSAVDIVGAYQAVFGLFQNTSLNPTPFYAVFTNSSDQLVALHYWFGFIVDLQTGYLFALTHGAGTNWTFSVNGVPFGGNSSADTFDFHVGAATWASGISFSELALFGGTPVDPPNVTASLDFATLRPAGWYLPTLARASLVGSLGRPWGIEGNLQHPTLAPGETVSGVDIAPLLNGTDLWNGGPAPVHLVASVLNPALPSLGATVLSVAVTGPSGAIPGVAVSFGGGAGGTFADATVLTSATGGATTTFTAPNVTRATGTSILATVSTFGYRGNASVGVNVSASVEVFLRAASNITVVASSTTGITFAAVAANGTPIPSLVVTFATTGVGGVDPTAAETDSSGTVSVALLAPGSVSNLVVHATVVDAGYWGAAFVGVHVAPRPVTGLITPVGLLLTAGGGALLLGVVLWIAVRRRRAPPLPLPPLPPLRAGTASPRANGVTRTPPASGNP